MNSVSNYLLHECPQREKQYQISDIDDKIVDEKLINDDRVYDLMAKMEQQIQVINAEGNNNYYKFLIDYDNTVLLQDHSGKSQDSLIPNSQCLNFLNRRQYTTLQELAKDWIQQMAEITAMINRKMSEGDYLIVRQAQYCILHFFDRVLDMMIQYKMKQAYIVSNSNIYLLYFGIFITANAVQLLQNEDKYPNVLLQMFQNKQLQVFSSNQVTTNPRKAQIFKQIMEADETKALVSIGDGLDEKESAEQLMKDGQNNAHVFLLSFQNDKEITVSNILQMHLQLFDTSIKDSAEFIFI